MADVAALFARVCTFAFLKTELRKKTKRVDQMRILVKLNALLMPILALSAHSSAQVANIDAGNVKQYIDGFGASTAWHGQLSDKEADAAFKNNSVNQLGLSILRIRIDPNGSYSDEMRNAQKAKARGALIFAAPWTPPARMKTNNNTVGGELKTSSYADYAAYLRQFCTTVGNVDVISLQNEPDASVTYESCTWNGAQLLDFCRNHASAIGTPVLMPESQGFVFAFSDPTLNDSVARSNVSFIGGHLYGTSPRNYANALDKGKRVWMTEHYYNPDDIATCINQMAKEIIDCMYNNFSAYVWWYLRQPDCNLINAGGSFRKKGYIMAHFSKFIRPGYHRIDATYRPQAGVYLVAFKGEETVIVVVNLNTSSKNQTFAFSSDSVAHVKRYTTSEAKNLSYDGIIDLADNSFTATLEGKSITTFVSTKTSTGVKLFDAQIPQSYSLEQNYPNPFNPSTVIKFSLPNVGTSRQGGIVSLKVYDVLGREVATLVDEELAAGNHSRQWNASNISSGVYFYRLQSGSFVETKKLVLLR
jgi:glucuronoarabinoxylan endo-1,4-beta-xylanase